MKKLFIFICICCVVLTGCGSKSKNDVQTLSKNQELTAMLKQDQNTPDFILLKTRYELPCKLQAFYDQGWELIDQIEANPFVKDTLSLKNGENVVLTLVKDFKQIDVKVANLGLDVVPLNGEAIVYNVIVYHTGNMSEDDMIWEGGATLKTSMDDLTAIYQEDKETTDEKTRLEFTAENKNYIQIMKNSDDKSIIESVEIGLGSDVYNRTNTLNFYENEVIDKAKNASLTFILRCESNKNYPPAAYETLISDIKDEKDNVRYFIVNATVVEKAAATNSKFLGINDVEIYVVEDELGNKYTVYSEIGDSFVMDDLNEGDKLTLYCSYADLLEVTKDTYYPLLTANIVYLNDTLLVDASGE